MSDFSKPEPLPIKTDNTPVWPLVIEDMKQRHEFGQKKYGTPLQTNNGRNALVDAYQELLDLAVYLRQYIEEEKERCLRYPNCPVCGGNSNDTLE